MSAARPPVLGSPSTPPRLRPGALPPLRGAAAGFLASLVLVTGPGSAGAQELHPIRVLAGPARGGCPPVAIVTAATPPDRRQQARTELRAGQEAALLGDQETALARFQEAARLDPTDPEAAYSLARVQEEAGAGAEALRELCRYLVLAPGAPDADEVRQRLAALLSPMPGAATPGVVERFETAVGLLDAGRLNDAEAAFSEVIRASPALAEAYFNRGLVRIAQDRARHAVQDLERYAELAAHAPNRDAVAATIAELTTARVSPAHALGRGLIVPGLGQVATQRPLLGALVFITVGGATALAVRTREETRTSSYEDRFGNPYEEHFTVRTRPHRDLGLAAALVVSVAAAAEAYRHAARSRGHMSDRPLQGTERAGPILEPGGSGSLRVGLRVPLSSRRTMSGADRSR